VIPTWFWGKKVAMTDMPQMVALFNGMGGGSAAAIGAGELLKYVPGRARRRTPAHVRWPCSAR
jgi:NAD(P) transhydrogenase subunit beta